jgi:hypothetical protein
MPFIDNFHGARYIINALKNPILNTIPFGGFETLPYVLKGTIRQDVSTGLHPRVQPCKIYAKIALNASIPKSAPRRVDSMKNKKTMPVIGFLAFALGILIAVVFGVFPFTQNIIDTIIVILIILGVIIGVLNITAKEIVPLLVAIIALIVVGRVFEPITYFGIGEILNRILMLISTLMAPPAVIAAIKTIFHVGFAEDI